MIWRKYYIIYVEVPTGYPGVEVYVLHEPADISSFIENFWKKEHKEYAVIGVLKGV